VSEGKTENKITFRVEFILTLFFSERNISFSSPKGRRLVVFHHPVGRGKIKNK
jgi:hypothetical protein